MDVAITWVDARLENPPDGDLVLAAVSGRYPAEDGELSSPEQDFWLVLPLYFRRVHPVEGTDQVITDCYRDADDVIRKPLGGGTEEVVTHWARRPTLPGVPAIKIVGASVAAAVAAATHR